MKTFKVHITPLLQKRKYPFQRMGHLTQAAESRETEHFNNLNKIVLPCYMIEISSLDHYISPLRSELEVGARIAKTNQA